MKIICTIFICLSMMFVGVNMRNQQYNLIDVFSASSKIEIINNGEIIKTNKDERQQIIEQFNKLISFGHEMPAFGVALNDEVNNQKKKGLFVEFIFDSMMEYDEMPFCRLLVEVSPDYSGFNIIRYYDGGYNGRCFYISLENYTMESFYDFLLTNLQK